MRLIDGKIGFVIDGIHEIQPGDINISEEDYKEFFERQQNGINFKPKLPFLKTASSLFDYLKEESVQDTEEPLEKSPEVIELEDKVKSLEAKLDLILSRL